MIWLERHALISGAVSYTHLDVYKRQVFGKEEPETASVLEEVMMRSQEKELYKAIRNLPVKQRTAVVLYYFCLLYTSRCV